MKHLIAFFMALFCVAASAQEVIVADTIDADVLFEKKAITQHKWSKYEYVDTCTTRYAVVHDWNGRCGIYDLEKHENLTELEYRDLYFSKIIDLEDGNQAATFLGYKGHRMVDVSVGPSGDAVAISMLDKDMCYSLDSCRTIDKKLTKMCRKLLEKDMKKSYGMYGQVLVMEAKTGHIKAWVALEDQYKNGKFEDAPLYKHQLCTDPMKSIWGVMGLVDSNTAWTDSVDTGCGCDSIGNMWIRDHNWYKGGYGKITYLDGFKNHSNIAILRAIEKSNPVSIEHEWWCVVDRPRETDALEVANMYNVIALGGKSAIESSVNTDSIRMITTDDIQGNELAIVKMMQNYLTATLQGGGIGSKWTSKKVKIAGDYLVHYRCQPTIYDNNALDMEKYYSEDGLPTYQQVIFVGYFPSDDPKYTICVSMDKEEYVTFGKMISNTVNKTVEYLVKH